MIDRANLKAYLESSKNFALEKVKTRGILFSFQYHYYNSFPKTKPNDLSLGTFGKI